MSIDHSSYSYNVSSFNDVAQKVEPNSGSLRLSPERNRRRPKVSTFGASMKTLGCCPRCPEALLGTVHLM